MDKKNIKNIYRLRIKYGNIRKVKKKMKEYYNIDLTEKEIRYCVLKMNFNNHNDIHQNAIYKNYILRFYKDCSNLDKAIEYINKKYNTNFNKNSLYGFAKKNNIQRINKTISSKSKLNLNDEINIVNLYENGYTTTQIAKLYNYKRKESILNILYKYNIKPKKACDVRKESKTYKGFSLDYIDSKEKAYFIGLLATDGNINKDRKYLNLSLTDKDVIEYLSSYINVKYKTIYSKNPNHKTKYDILLFGEEYIKQCERIGLYPNKTYTINKLNLYEKEKEYIPYILRGIIDGDGWIRKDGKEFFICSASYGFLKWCKEQLEYLGFINLNIKFIPNDKKGIYIIRNGSIDNMYLLKTLIYNKELGMKRKRERLYEKNVQRT